VHQRDIISSHKIDINYLCCVQTANDKDEDKNVLMYEMGKDTSFDIHKISSPHILQRYCFSLCRYLSQSERTFTVDSDKK